MKRLGRRGASLRSRHERRGKRLSGGPRDYTVATERALFRLAQETCYFPGCATPVIAVEDGHPIVGVEIAHIRGANPTSARYDPSMTDAERASYGNLILLCVPHHKLVDRLEPEKYPVELLTKWKVDNETTEGMEALRSVANDANLEDLIASVVERLGPRREVEVELTPSPVDARSGTRSRWRRRPASYPKRCAGRTISVGHT